MRAMARPLHSCRYRVPGPDGAKQAVENMSDRECILLLDGATLRPPIRFMTFAEQRKVMWSRNFDMTALRYTNWVWRAQARIAGQM